MKNLIINSWCTRERLLRVGSYVTTINLSARNFPRSFVIAETRGILKRVSCIERERERERHFRMQIH